MKPEWLKVRLPGARTYRATAGLLRRLELHTVCDEARCPNKGECFAAGTATFLILGRTCSRSCRFCAVDHGAPDGVIDHGEPLRVAEAAAALGLRHVVVTSVTRDDLTDGGAGHFAATVRAIRDALPDATVEVLIPDFGGDEVALATVLDAAPEVLNHNIETVPRLYARVRPQADYARSLELLRRASEWARRGADGAAPRLTVKTGLMVGLGETWDEVDGVLADCRDAGVVLATVGQYLQPRGECLPVARFVAPDEFVAAEKRGAALGLRVIAAPFVRSSYRAAEALLGASS